MTETSGEPYHGPYAMFTLAEVRRIADALAGRDDDVARSILSKCSAALTSDPRLREPHP